MKKKKYFLAALLTLLLFHAAPAQEVADTPNNWFGVGVGLTSLDVQVGHYDLIAKRLHGRLLASYIYGGGFLVDADMLLSTGRQSGFYLGLGASAIGDFSFVALGPSLVIGGDVPINSRSGITIDSSFSFYPFFPVYGTDDVGMIFPFYGRFSVGYRYSF